MRVLVCRRTMELARSAQEIIRQSGRHRIIGYMDAKNADPERMRASGADVFVLDGVMPYQDGPTLAGRLLPLPCILIEPGTTGILGENVRWVPGEEGIVQALDALADEALPSDVRSTIHQALLQLGFKPHTRGTQQLEAALEIALRDEETLTDVFARIYAPIGLRMDCTPASVERNIRYAIECAWVRGELTVLQELFGYTIQAEKGKPTNRAFLAQLCEHIRLRRAYTFP